MLKKKYPRMEEALKWINGVSNHALKKRSQMDNLVGLGNVKSFVIVRHPFDRLVSAFRDKLERLHGKKPYSEEWYYVMYGRKAVKFRKEATKKFGPEFLR